MAGASTSGFKSELTRLERDFNADILRQARSEAEQAALDLRRVTPRLEAWRKFRRVHGFSQKPIKEVRQELGGRTQATAELWKFIPSAVSDVFSFRRKKPVPERVHVGDIVNPSDAIEELNEGASPQAGPGWIERTLSKRFERVGDFVKYSRFSRFLRR